MFRDSFVKSAALNRALGRGIVSIGSTVVLSAVLRVAAARVTLWEVDWNHLLKLERTLAWTSLNPSALVCLVFFPCLRTVCSLVLHILRKLYIATVLNPVH